MVQQLNSHLDVGRLAGNNDQPFALRASRSAVSSCTWLHDLYLACAHVADLIDFTPALADNATDQTVGYIDLLCLHRLLRRVVRGTVAWPWCWWAGGRIRSGDVRRATSAVLRTPRARGGGGCWPVGRTSRRWHALIRLDEDGTNVVGGDMDGVGNTCDAQDTLERKDLIRKY